MSGIHRALIAIAALALLSSVGCGDDSSVSGSLLVADRNGDVWEMDRSTGELTFVVSLYTEEPPPVMPAVAGGGPSGGVPIQYDITHVSSMAYDAEAETLYVATGGNGDYAGQIFEVDLTTGQGVSIYDNAMGSVRAWPGLTLRKTDGYLFGHMETDDDIWIFDEMGVFSDSYSIDVWGYGNALTFNRAGTRLYHGDGGENEADPALLYEIDPLDGTVLSERNLTYSSIDPFLAADPDFGTANPRLSAMTVAEDTGRVYGILQEFFEADRLRFLVRVDLGSSRLTHVADINNNLDGLVYVPEGVVPDPPPEI